MNGTRTHVMRIECTCCGSQRAMVHYVSKYRGLRGTCPECGADWPES